MDLLDQLLEEMSLQIQEFLFMNSNMQYTIIEISDFISVEKSLKKCSDLLFVQMI